MMCFTAKYTGLGEKLLELNRIRLFLCYEEAFSFKGYR